MFTGMYTIIFRQKNTPIDVTGVSEVSVPCMHGALDLRRAPK